MHSAQTQSSVGAASSWMQRKWYTRGQVSQLITTPSLWHNQQNWSVEDPTDGNGVATGDCCCKQNLNNKMLYKQGSFTIIFTYTKCEFLTMVMTKFRVFWDVTHVNRQTATDVLEKHTASICRFLLDCYTLKTQKVRSSDMSVTFSSWHNLYLHLCTLLYPYGIKNNVVSSKLVLVTLRVYFQN
jgi:hypothetical protein